MRDSMLRQRRTVCPTDDQGTHRFSFCNVGHPTDRKCALLRDFSSLSVVLWRTCLRPSQRSGTAHVVDCADLLDQGSASAAGGYDLEIWDLAGVLPASVEPEMCPASGDHGGETTNM